MTAVLQEQAHPSVRPSLLRAELRRFRSRRFIRVLLALALVGFVAAVGFSFTQYEKTTDATRAEARQEIAGYLAQSEQFRQQCLADPASVGAPAGADPEQVCGEEQTVESYGDVENFLDKQPFSLASDGLDGAMAVAFATGALTFLVGATFIGAEWSSRSLVALLFWETRRLRVMGAKLLVLGVAAALLAVITQAAWFGDARLLGSTVGTTTVPDDFTGDLLGTAGRGVLVAVVAALLGFGIANAVRNTAASLGVGFLYFAVVESAIRALKPAWAQWLLTDNAVALVQNDRFTIYLDDGYVDSNGTFVDGGREIVLTHLHAGVLLTVVALVVVGVGVLLFQRRDLS